MNRDHDRSRTARTKPQLASGLHEVRPHPLPETGTVHSLNDALRRELWYVDTMVAMPFRMLRRTVAKSSGLSGAQAAGEALWAMEGMARLPVKLLQAALGESLEPSRRMPTDGEPVRRNADPAAAFDSTGDSPGITDPRA